MTVRRLEAGEGTLLRTLRLRALAESPDAFADSYAAASAKPASYWEEMTRSVTDPGRHTMVVAEEGPTPIGLAFGLLDRDAADVAHLGGMWVDPKARGRGVGRVLADAVLVWARERGFARVVVWVTEGNAAAITLYERLGFTRTGRRDRLPSNPALEVFEMALPLAVETRAS